MYFYWACGLTIQSEILLPELVEFRGQKADVTIRYENILRPDPTSNYNFLFQCDAQQVLFDWQYIGAFVVRGSGEVVVCPNPDVEESLVRLPLLGVVFATLLHRSGFLVLHGSAIAVDERAVAFIGEKGMGKSTTTVALFKRGHAPITDDIVAIDWRSPNEPLVYPSFPQLKLWPHVALSVGENPDVLPEVSAGIIKRVYSVSSGFKVRPLPLEGIYILSFGGLSIHSYGPQEALKQLIAHSYCTRFGSQLLQGESAGNHFTQCADLVRQVPVRQLVRPHALEGLSDVMQALEEDVATLSP